MGRLRRRRRSPAGAAGAAPRTRACRPLLAVAAAAALAGPTGGRAQDLNELALAWTRGEFGAPLVCEKEGRARRGLRRILVTEGPRHLRPPANKIRFIELRVPEGSRCFTDTGEDQPDVQGALLFQLEGHSRPDIAGHDFQDTLRREGGFTFDVRAGTLTIAGKPVDFSGGTAFFGRVQPGSDAYRRLSDLPDTRKLQLILKSVDGTEIAFDLVQSGLR